VRLVRRLKKRVKNTKKRIKKRITFIKIVGIHSPAHKRGLTRNIGQKRIKKPEKTG
jgi:hypothetical protein